MHINFDLFRDILIDIDEDDGAEDLDSDCLTYDYATEKEKLFHIKLLVREGYISAINTSSADGISFSNMEMTIKGALFLEQFRDQTIFERVKEIAIKSFQATSLSDFITIAKTLYQNP